MKVYALNDDVKKYIHHPHGAVPRFDDNGEADWPDDQFTRRRVRDGDISLEPPGQRAGEQKAGEQKAEQSKAKKEQSAEERTTQAARRSTPSET